jgi:hypothetical protein
VTADPGAAWIEFQLLLLDAGAQIRDTIPDPVTQPGSDRHQERELKDEPCGCQLIWCRGRWWPKFTCLAHWDGVIR